ncbi:hypothetical protein CF8_0153 [Aeromonas phage CF8]|nr:hypothetical protein CF8_0153 [Aeromonas phage CF8]
MADLNGIEVRENPIAKALMDAMNPELYIRLENVGELLLEGIFNGIGFKLKLNRCMGSFLLNGFIDEKAHYLSKSKTESAVVHKDHVLTDVKEVLEWNDLSSLRDSVENLFIPDSDVSDETVINAMTWCLNERCITRGLFKLLGLREIAVAQTSDKDSIIFVYKEQVLVIDWDNWDEDELEEFIGLTTK